MAKMSAADMACAKLQEKISEHQREIDGLVRAMQIIRADEATAAEPKPRRTRGPNKQKRGLPNANAQPTMGE